MKTSYLDTFPLSPPPTPHPLSHVFIPYPKPAFRLHNSALRILGQLQCYDMDLVLCQYTHRYWNADKLEVIRAECAVAGYISREYYVMFCTIVRSVPANLLDSILHVYWWWETRFNSLIRFNLIVNLFWFVWFTTSKVSVVQSIRPVSCTGTSFCLNNQHLFTLY